MNDIKKDPLLNNPEAQVSQIIQKVFLMGFLVGRGQLQDDADSMGSPMGQTLSQLQDQFNLLMPGSKDAANVTSFNKFVQQVEDIKKKEKEQKVKIKNPNLTPNEDRLNEQHDEIVRSLLESLQEEMKPLAAEIVKETKHLKK